jgi:LuxR family transcriptional regulator, maltose regulon positive regulatory protein
MTRRFTAVAKNFQSLPRALTLFETKGDAQGRLLSLAAFIETSLFKSHDLIPLSELLARAENLLNSLSQDLYLREKAVLWLQIGFGQTVRGGDPRKGYWACQNAYLLAKESGETLLQIEALIHGYEALIWLGELPLADAKAEAIEKLLAKHPYPEMVAYYDVASSVKCILRGDFKKTEELMQSGQKECERLGFLSLYQMTLIHLLILKPSLGQHEEAKEIGTRLLQFLASVGSSFMTGIALFYLGRNAYFQENLTEARASFQEAHHLLSRDEVYSPLHLHLLGICNALVFDAGDQEGTVLQNLHNALSYFSNMSSFLVIQAHFALALSAWNRKDQDQIRIHVQAGFRLAREKADIEFLFINPLDMAKVCALGMELGDREDNGLSAHLLNTRLAPLAGPHLDRLSRHPDPRIRTRVSEIRTSFRRSTLPRLKIETLGRFRIIRCDAPIDRAEWHGGQAKTLLKAIITRGPQGIQKEALIENLWPEGSPHKAETTFKVALHRLRRILEPEPTAGDQGYAYVRLKGNRVYLDGELCQVDAERFSTLFEEGEKREESRQLKEALLCYKEAAELYQGDFLPDDRFAGWTEPKREALRRQYLRLLLKMARIYEDRGAPSKAISAYEKALAFDPLAEKACRRLMVLYHSLGRRNEAIKVFRSCEKALRETLETEPEASMVSTFKKISTTA